MASPAPPRLSPFLLYDKAPSWLAVPVAKCPVLEIRNIDGMEDALNAFYSAIRPLLSDKRRFVKLTCIESKNNYVQHATKCLNYITVASSWTEGQLKLLFQGTLENRAIHRTQLLNDIKSRTLFVIRNNMLPNNVIFLLRKEPVVLPVVSVSRSIEPSTSSSSSEEAPVSSSTEEAPVSVSSEDGLVVQELPVRQLNQGFQVGGAIRRVDYTSEREGWMRFPTCDTFFEEPLRRYSGLWDLAQIEIDDFFRLELEPKMKNAEAVVEASVIKPPQVRRWKLVRTRSVDERKRIVEATFPSSRAFATYLDSLRLPNSIRLIEKIYLLCYAGIKLNWPIEDINSLFTSLEFIEAIEANMEEDSVGTSTRSAFYYHWMTLIERLKPFVSASKMKDKKEWKAKLVNSNACIDRLKALKDKHNKTYEEASEENKLVKQAREASLGRVISDDNLSRFILLTDIKFRFHLASMLSKKDGRRDAIEASKCAIFLIATCKSARLIEISGLPYSSNLTALKAWRSLMDSPRTKSSSASRFEDYASQGVSPPSIGKDGLPLLCFMSFATKASSTNTSTTFLFEKGIDVDIEAYMLIVRPVIFEMMSDEIKEANKDKLLVYGNYVSSAQNIRAMLSSFSLEHFKFEYNNRQKRKNTVSETTQVVFSAVSSERITPEQARSHLSYLADDMGHNHQTQRRHYAQGVNAITAGAVLSARSTLKDMEID